MNVVFFIDVLDVADEDTEFFKLLFIGATYKQKKNIFLIIV
jgi:hypothetical protein